LFTYDSYAKPCTTLFRDQNCKGLSDTFCFDKDDYDEHAFDKASVNKGVGDNQASSMTVPEHSKVRLYNGKGFSDLLAMPVG
jgi:hypothetical protein